FGMIIYGYKHVRDAFFFADVDRSYQLGLLYSKVSQVIARHEACARLPDAQKKVAAADAALKIAKQTAQIASKTDKKFEKTLRQAKRALEDADYEHQELTRI